MQELETTMKQLEELTAKRFEVLQKVAGREIEAAKAAEADKYNKKAVEEANKPKSLLERKLNRIYSTLRT